MARGIERGIGFGILALVSVTCARRELGTVASWQKPDAAPPGMAVGSQPGASEPGLIPPIGPIDSPDAAPPMDPPPDASPSAPWDECWAMQEGSPACDTCTRRECPLGGAAIAG